MVNGEISKDSFLHRHSRAFLKNRQESIKSFHNKLKHVRSKVPELQEIKEYQDKINKRLDYIRRKRRSLAA